MILQRVSIFFFLVLSIAFVSCEPNNPYDTGPAYDIKGNLAKDSVLIANYLQTADIDSLYRIHDPSGVVIIVQEEGDGTRPNTGNVVYTDYTGSLMSDGTVFDTSLESVARDNDLYEKDRDYNFLALSLYPLNQQGGFISGWNIAFRRLRPGSKAVLIIPSTWAYRDNPPKNSNIPDNSILIFDIDFKGMD